MNDPIAVLLKFAFLALLFLFVLWIARSSLRDVAVRVPGRGGGPDRDGESRAGGDAGPAAVRGVQPRLEVVAAMGYHPGDSFDLNGGIMLGRSPTADLQIDDPFASAAHARIFPRGQFMYIEDMGSTNGTFLNGHQLDQPQQLQASDSIRIGDTEYRYQE